MMKYIEDVIYKVINYFSYVQYTEQEFTEIIQNT